MCVYMFGSADRRCVHNRPRSFVYAGFSTNRNLRTEEYGCGKTRGNSDASRRLVSLGYPTAGRKLDTVRFRDYRLKEGENTVVSFRTHSQ